MNLVRQGSSELVHTEDVEQRLSSSALLLDTPRTWYTQIPGSCFSCRNFAVADLKKSIENAQVEHNKCRP